MLSFLLLLALSAPVLAATLRLHHRLYHPAAHQLPFAQRATLHIDASLHPTFQPEQSLSEYLTHAVDRLQADGLQLDDLQYQLALERPADSAEAQWDISSVKLCHLEQSKSELLFLHASEGPEPAPYALDYFVASAPHDGSCRRPKAKSKSTKTGSESEALSSRLHHLAARLEPLNTTVSMRHSGLPPLPELRTPPPLTETGDPVAPVAEKSFLQKYWLYIVAVLIALMVSGGPPEEDGRK